MEHGSTVLELETVGQIELGMVVEAHRHGAPGAGRWCRRTQAVTGFLPQRGRVELHDATVVEANLQHVAIDPCRVGAQERVFDRDVAPLMTESHDGLAVFGHVETATQRSEHAWVADVLVAPAKLAHRREPQRHAAPKALEDLGIDASGALPSLPPNTLLSVHDLESTNDPGRLHGPLLRLGRHANGPMMTSSTLFGRALAVACMAALACGGKTESTPAPTQAKAEPPAGEPVAAEPPARVGQVAPDFELPGDTGTLVKLAEHRGKQPVLLAFYPKDFTSG